MVQPAREERAELTTHLRRLTRTWGNEESVTLFLDRCRVDTPEALVAATWKHVLELRSGIRKVIDFGAGDGRFARHGEFSEYIGYEIDRSRCSRNLSVPGAELVNRCAFSDEIHDADVCIGNPPFVRNQDLPSGWRQKAAEVLQRRTGVELSGLANAWQYFFLLALASTTCNGLCALILPFEWVSRPSVRRLRDYIAYNKWNVSVYRLVDSTFNSVLTTSSITIIDKSELRGNWRYFEETSDGSYRALDSPSGGPAGVLPYLKRSEVDRSGPMAIRGLSPGTQKVLTLTEGERVRNGLSPERDVVPCTTTLRPLPPDALMLDASTFRSNFRETGEKCWLIRTDTEPSTRLKSYIESVPPRLYQTSTCMERQVWWQFAMPPIPDVLISMSFRGQFPKAVTNEIGARAIGGVYGIYNLSSTQASQITEGLGGVDIRGRIVAHSHGLRKLEVNQLNALLSEAFGTNIKES